MSSVVKSIKKTYTSGCLGLGGWGGVGGGRKWELGGSTGKRYGGSFRVMKIF